MNFHSHPQSSTVIHSQPQSPFTLSPRPTTTVSCGVWGVCVEEVVAFISSASTPTVAHSPQ